MGFEWMPQRRISIDFVAVLATSTGSLEHSRCFEIGNDPLHRAFRDADLKGNIAHSQLGIDCEA
jgi:hypothetical protein